MIIDWHNLAYSILALRLGDSHPLVLIAEWYEKVFSRTATANLAVSEAMARTLKRDFLIQSPLLVLHDRPAESFQPLTPEQRLSFLARLRRLLHQPPQRRHLEPSLHVSTYRTASEAEESLEARRHSGEAEGQHLS